MAQIENLRDFLAEARRRERLHEFAEPINKESELMPLYRVQTRGLPEEERSVLLFNDVRGSDGAASEHAGRRRRLWRVARVSHLGYGL